MRMNFGLFEPRVCCAFSLILSDILMNYHLSILVFEQGDDNGVFGSQLFLFRSFSYMVFLDTDRERETQVYSVDNQYSTYWSAAKTHNYCSIMPVFDTNDAPVDANRFADKLLGAMCEITFTLKHITIASRRKPDGNVVEATDVFSAQVESISILRNPPTLPRSPYKGRIRRKPQHTPQLPSRGEQVNSSMAFVPRPDFGTSIIEKSTNSTLLPRVNATASPSSLGEDTTPSVAATLQSVDPSATLPAPSTTTSSTLLGPLVLSEASQGVLKPQSKFIYIMKSLPS